MKHSYKIMVLLLCALVFTACSAKAADLNESISSQSNTASVNEASSITPPSPLSLAKTANPDTAAWLRIPGTDVDNSVMQTGNNEDYLRHNENKEYDVWGYYFADYFANLSGSESLAQNTVIYGHSESTESPDGERFTQLFRYLDLEFLKANPNFYLTIDDEELPFQIFAVFFTDTDFYYIDPSPSNQGFESFMAKVNAKNEFVFDGTPVTQADKLLTLSTCAYRYDTAKTGNHRLVVMAKQVEDDAAMPWVTVNPKPQK